ncbi:MAG: GLUG motif-containing protein, partial [Sphaerochaetaceae bacterium]
MKKRRVKLCILITLIVLFISSFIILLNLQNQSPDFNEDKIAINYRTPQSASVFMAEVQDGSEENPYIISNAEDMNALSQAVSAGNTFAGKIIVVASGISEINLGDFQPIGTNTRVFSGIFDGSGVNFRLSIDKLETDYVGLFGVVERGTIENLSVSGTITGKNRVGGIVGQQNVGSIIRNVYNTATVIGNERVGGIVGYINQGTVTNTYNRGEIIGNASVGGVVGYTYIYRYNRSTTPITVVVTNNYSSGLVTANSRVGGVIGYLDPLRYSTSSTYSAVTTRSNLYYDITVIANYAQKRAIKPSSLVSTEGLDSGQMFNIMTTKLTSSGWFFRPSSDGLAYYPQLTVFSDNENEDIKIASTASVIVDISDGLGTEDYPFILYNKQDLEDMKTKINAGNTFEGFYFVISNTYEETDLGNFSPIGIDGKPFYGSFDGNHTQFTLAIDTAGDYQGLFGRFGRGTIKNLSVVGSIKAGSYVGGIVGYQESGIIENVYNLATITAASNVGGLVGLQANGTIRVSYNDGDIDASGNNIGGIVGRLNQGTVTNTYNRGEIVGNRYVGGLVGYTYRFRYVTSNTPITINITNSYSAGLVSANQNVGGTIGFNDTTRYSSSSTYAAQTVQSNLYYDVSILSTYDQPKDLKPSTVVTGSQFTTDKLIYTSDSQLGFTAGTWYYRAKEGTTAYYPQLIVFSTSSVTHISTDSIHSTSYDVGDGLGTKEFPFLIRTKFDMDELSRKVAEGNTYIGYHFKVDDGIDHIDLEAFIPIGNASVAFRGNFDGNGTNFNIHTTNDQVDYQGLFGVVDTGIIENLSVSGTITGKNRVGGIVGQQNVGSIIRNVYNTATVIGNE